MSNNIATLNPYDIFIGLDGKPLNGGYIYVGVAGQDPEVAPVSIFWDTAGTIPAAQPLRTLNGYLSNGGSPARIALNGSYSVRVRDKKLRQVYFEPNALITATGQGVSLIADSGGFIAKLLTSAGEISYGVYTQAAARIVELLGLGSTAPALYGIQPGMAGINTPAGVDFTIGTGDTVKMTFNDTNDLIGIGKVPAAGGGLIQLQGSASGGIDFGNVDNAVETAFDQYRGKSATVWTPTLRFGGASVGLTYSTQIGRYTRIGNMVFCRMRIVLTNKGSSTGTCTIAGLPVPPLGVVASIPEFIPMEFGLMTPLSSLRAYGLSGTPGSSVLTLVGYLLDGSASTPLTLSDAQVTSGSIIDGAFCYQVA
jgi:hypothetical protein